AEPRKSAKDGCRKHPGREPGGTKYAGAQMHLPIMQGRHWQESRRLLSGNPKQLLSKGRVTAERVELCPEEMQPMARWRDPYPAPIDGGQYCPKCRRPMQRYRHSKAWLPEPGRGFFHWWDRCDACQHVQHYEAAHGEPDELPDTEA